MDYFVSIVVEVDSYKRDSGGSITEKRGAIWCVTKPGYITYLRGVYI